MSQSEKFCLKWNNFQQNISHSFTKLRRESHFFDVTLVSADQRQIKAHKVVLSACSEFFKSILSENSHGHPLLYIDGISAAQMEQVLDYIYHGEVNIYQEDLDNFLSIAQKLKLEGLLELPYEDQQKNTFDQRKIEEETEEIQNTFLGMGKVKNYTKDYENSFREHKALKTFANVNVQSNEELNSKFDELVVKEGTVYRCTVCAKSMTHRGSMKRHVETHLTGLSYDCQHCGKTFRSSQACNRNRHKCC